MATDPTLANLATLEPQAAEAAYWLVYAARQAGYPVIVTSARRNMAEQRRLLELGRTKTLNSSHLSGRAFDIDWFRTNRDQVPRWFWDLIGPWAELQLGLKWGGRFHGFWDPGHFELPR